MLSGIRLARHSLEGMRARNWDAWFLSPFLQWYFDTTMGAKTDAESYRPIATVMTVPPAPVVFVSDVARELDAARSAGMATRLSISQATSRRLTNTDTRRFEPSTNLADRA